MQLSDRVTGLFMVALGSLAAYGGSRLPPVPGQQIGPNVFPLVVGIGLAICGAMIALRIGRRYEEEAEADLAQITGQTVTATDAADHAPWWRSLKVLVPPGLLLFYVVAVDALGFLPTAAAMVLIASLALGGRVRLAIPLAIGAPLFVNLVFAKLLRVPLPSGLLPLPWLGLP
ncbi:MAG TPA: tripartite tricarboxylate transporter TctB family protein [Xanthobacteraceae bacterium]|nr:tripartite tricarboxylate transporter TctB family protein [Xanthobacteraceae bacterium]